MNAFPVLSQTFIANEIIGLRMLGLDLALYSLFKPKANEENWELEALKTEIDYLLPARLYKLVTSHLIFLFRFPGRYVRTLFFALKHRKGGASMLSALWRLAISKKELSKSQRQDLLWHFFLVGPLARNMMRQNVSHINSHFADAAASFAMLASKLLSIPYSITAHAYDVFTSQANFEEKFTKASFIITCTKFNKQFVQEKYPHFAGKIHVVYHGIDVEKFKPPHRKKVDKATILSVGRLVPKKGMVVLVEACRILKEQGMPFRCRIVGDGPERPRLEMKIKLDDLVDEIELVGSVMPGQMKDFYEQATLFALPCIVEENGNRDGIPNVIAEAMAMELPVVSTFVSAIPELVENGKTGLLVEQADARALAKAIQEIVQHPRKARKMGLEGRKRVVEIFDARKNLVELKQLYDNLVVNR